MKKAGSQLPLLALIACFVAPGCASGQQAGLLSPNATPKDAFLVEVVDRIPPGSFSVVSVATRPPQRGSKLPSALGDREVEAHRGFAAQYGAEHLVVERVDNAYRRVFYLLGLSRVARGATAAGPPLKTPQCIPANVDAALDAARAKARRCVEGLREKRPALTGTLKVRLEIDRFGGVYAADITPDSSRDGQLQACAKRAIFAQTLPAQPPLMCHVLVDLTP